MSYQQTYLAPFFCAYNLTNRDMPKKLTREEFIERAKKRYGDKYDFSRVVYDSFNSEIIVGCSKHGFVKTKAYGVLRGTWECPMCRQEKRMLNAMVRTDAKAKTINVYPISDGAR